MGMTVAGNGLEQTPLSEGLLPLCWFRVKRRAVGYWVYSRFRQASLEESVM
jgi:hypothetical protein